MNATAARGKTINIELNHFAARKYPFQRIPCRRVGFRIAEFRGDHCTVANVEIDVSRGKAIDSPPRL